MGRPHAPARFSGEPVWWPLPLLLVAGVLAGLTIRYLPGRGGHTPADWFQLHAPSSPASDDQAG